MIAALAKCILSTFGFGSVLCLNRDAEALVAELRKFGLAASDNAASGETFDFVLTDRFTGEESEVRWLTATAKRGLVIAAPSGSDLAGQLNFFNHIGFRLHSRASSFELLGLKTDCQFCVLEPGAENVGFQNSSSLPALGSLATEIAKLVSPGDRLQICGENSAFVSRVISANSRVGDITTRKSPEVGGAGLFDLILLCTSDDLEDLSRDLVESIANSLKPSGRLILATFASSPRSIRTKEWLASVLVNDLIPEALIVPNEAPKILRESIWVRYTPSDQQYWAAGWQAIVVMRSPLVVRAKFPPTDFPSFPFDDLAAQYDNPWLVRAMISVESRLVSAQQLEELADEVIATSVRRSDIAAAYCVKSYLVLGQQRPWSDVYAVIKSFDHLLVAAAQSDPIDIRWAVSLSYVKALAEQKYGHRTAARQSFEKCARYPFLQFAPMLATKTISACQQVAFICLADGDGDGALEWFMRGLEQSLAAIRDDRFNLTALYPPYFLPELSQVIALGSQCNGALIALKEKGISPLVCDMLKHDIFSQIQEERLTSAALRQTLHSVLSVDFQ